MGMIDSILYVCYNDSCRELPNKIRELYPEIEVVAYDENHYKEKKKAYKIKGGYSARATPFMLLLGKNKEYLKAFYSEDNGCTIDKLTQFINYIKPLYENESKSN
jgi:hypothetical protein